MTTTTNTTLLRNIVLDTQAALEHLEAGNIDAAANLLQDIAKVCDVEADRLEGRAGD